MSESKTYKMNSRTLTFGHTVQEDGMVTRCGGRLHLIDVGISSRYLGRGAAWQGYGSTLAPYGCSYTTPPPPSLDTPFQRSPLTPPMPGRIHTTFTWCTDTPPMSGRTEHRVYTSVRRLSSWADEPTIDTWTTLMNPRVTPGRPCGLELRRRRREGPLRGQDGNLAESLRRRRRRRRWRRRQESLSSPMSGPHRASTDSPTVIIRLHPTGCLEPLTTNP